MMENITERHHLQTRLRHQALHDPLTGLPNRTVFFERLDAALRAGSPDDAVGVCYLDLDDFKAVNDTLGHDTGDALLRAVAQRLGTDLGRDGHLVARMGGDEFVVLVEHSTGLEHLERVAQTALDTVRRPVAVGRPPDRRVRQRRHRASTATTAPRRRRRADAGRGHHPVLGQGRRPGPVRRVRRRTPPQRRPPVRAVRADARRRWPRRIRRRVPAVGPAAGPADHRGGGTGPLAAAQRRTTRRRPSSSRWPRTPA